MARPVSGVRYPFGVAAASKHRGGRIRVVLTLGWVAACGSVTSTVMDGGADRFVRDASDGFSFEVDASDASPDYDIPSCDSGPLSDDAGDAGSIPCTPDASCNANVEYCYSAGGGPPPGFNYSACRALPAGCHACECLICSSSPGGCACQDNAGRIEVSCAFP